jgi:hypothetical protein
MGVVTLLRVAVVVPRTVGVPSLMFVITVLVVPPSTVKLARIGIGEGDTEMEEVGALVQRLAVAARKVELGTKILHNKHPVVAQNVLNRKT